MPTAQPFLQRRKQRCRHLGALRTTQLSIYGYAFHWRALLPVELVAWEAASHHIQRKRDGKMMRLSNLAFLPLLPLPSTLPSHDSHHNSCLPSFGRQTAMWTEQPRSCPPHYEGSQKESLAPSSRRPFKYHRPGERNQGKGARDGSVSLSVAAVACLINRRFRSTKIAVISRRGDAAAALSSSVDGEWRYTRFNVARDRESGATEKLQFHPLKF